MRTFAIGDVHGCLTALRTLEQQLNFSADDTVIMLGDYVDRGPDSCGVLEYLIGLKERCNLITLRGNHEVMMLDARSDQKALMGWIINGGDAALESYGPHVRGTDGIPEHHWDFLQQTLSFYEPDEIMGHPDGCFFVHANVDPKKPLEEQDDNTRFWQHLDPPKQKPHVSGKRMICGHTSQKNGEVLVIGQPAHTICIDTWACGGKWLTCLNVETMEYWQANDSGQFRRRKLDV